MTAPLVPCPAGDDCEFLRGATTANDPRTPREAHDFLIGIEDAEGGLVAQFIAGLIADTATGAGPHMNLSLLNGEPTDFRRFVEIHNWRNPRLMAYVAELVEIAIGVAWKSPEWVATREAIRGADERHALAEGAAVA